MRRSLVVRSGRLTGTFWAVPNRFLRGFEEVFGGGGGGGELAGLGVEPLRILGRWRWTGS